MHARHEWIRRKTQGNNCGGFRAQCEPCALSTLKRAFRICNAKQHKISLWVDCDINKQTLGIKKRTVRALLHLSYENSQQAHKWRQYVPISGNLANKQVFHKDRSKKRCTRLNCCVAIEPKSVHEHAPVECSPSVCLSKKTENEFVILKRENRKEQPCARSKAGNEEKETRMK